MHGMQDFVKDGLRSGRKPIRQCSSTLDLEKKCATYSVDDMSSWDSAERGSSSLVDVFGGSAGGSGLLVDVSWALGTGQVGGSLIDDIFWGAAGLAGSLIGDAVRWDATGLTGSLVDVTSWWDTTGSWAAAGRLLACTLLGSVMVICKVDIYLQRRNRRVYLWVKRPKPRVRVRRRA